MIKQSIQGALPKAPGKSAPAPAHVDGFTANNAHLFDQYPMVAQGISADLIAALDSGHLAGAVLDVFQAEPMGPENPIWRHPKITATPHIAALTDQKAALAFIGDCVTRCESGQPLENVVDLNRGY